MTRGFESWGLLEQRFVRSTKQARSAGPVDQIWPMLCGQPQPLVAPPALDLYVVPAQQRLWHGPARPVFRSRVLRAIKQPVDAHVETVLLVTPHFTKHSRLQPGNRVEQRHGRDFAAGQHQIAQADLRIHMCINETLVDAFVPAANQNRTGTCGPPLYRCMVQNDANRRKENHGGRVIALKPGPRKAFGKRLGQQHHPWAATVGPVVDPAITSLAIVPRIVQAHIDLTRRVGAPGDTHAKERREQLRKQRDNIKAHCDSIDSIQ